jgi:DNA-binding transcriptional ArsR family regulator
MLKGDKMVKQTQTCNITPPIDVFTITDLETLKVVADPLRLQILDLLRGEPQTVKQLNETLQIALSKLYYHVGLLEHHHLIRVTQTRMVSGILEKHYQATAYKLSVDHALLSSPLAASPATSGLDIFLSAVLDATKKDIQRSVQEGLIDLTDDARSEQQLYLGRCWARLSPRQVQHFRARLEALTEEFTSLAPDPDCQELSWYEWLDGLYPTHTEPGATRQGLEAYRSTPSTEAVSDATTPTS